ncbi:major facilitator superfamily domain-containing protein [Lentinula aff. detonsa]|uniref:Major facilitator superfamily domain-containing protein n=1 Tax=Lentinula aff. detonsa TaxID=2804958 RepID=A0AA38KV40_9AGAR|nr:major facilitator superfamily domain-containing protein [Lentinula aff. detonsa]KAJ3792314.1 major facilitator superfamily domain-containing protein [Lentinula aff. detonsa]
MSQSIQLSEINRSREATHSQSSISNEVTLNHTHSLVDEMPEGGYGWVVVASCSVIMFFSVGGFYSWGVIQAQLAAESIAPNSTLAFIGSLGVSFIAFGAIFMGRLIRWVGARNAGFLSCLLMGGGQILSSASSKNVGGLFVTNGIIVGLGTSMSFMLCSTLPSQYFTQKRGLANGAVFSAAGIGGAILSVVQSALISRLGVAWTFRIIGAAIIALTFPACCFLKDRLRRSTATIEWSLFLDPRFVMLALGSAIGTFPLLVPPFFLPLYTNSLGLAASAGSILLAVFNVSSAIGRVSFGALCDICGPITSLSLALILSALSLLAIWPVSNSLAPLMVFAILNGFGNGGFFSTIPSVVAHMYGPIRVTTVFSMVLTGWAAGYLLGAPIAGWLLDAYGGSGGGIVAYRPAMYYAGSLSVGSTGFILGVRILTTKKNLFTFA